MASIVNDPNGRMRTLFIGRDGQRRAIRMGKANTRQAESFNVKVEQLVTSGVTGSLDDETARWLAELDDVMHEKLTAVGLIKGRNRVNVTLNAFLDEYFASVVVKASTKITYKQTRRTLLEYFGETRRSAR